MDFFHELLNYVEQRSLRRPACGGLHVLSYMWNTIKNTFYSPLKRPDHIRVLELLPSQEKGRSQIHVQIHERALDEAKGTCKAVSYALGDASRPKRLPILYGGSKAFITPTLHSILARLRDTSASRYLWVDALCINQSRESLVLAERVLQVGLMSRISPGAEKVVVSLGERQKDDEYLLQTLQEPAAIPRSKWERVAPHARAFQHLDGEDLEYEEQPVAARIYQTTRIEFQTLEDILPVGLEDTRLWQAYKNLLSRPWLGRLWIIQEHPLSNEVWFMLGPKLVLSLNFGRGLARMVLVESIVASSMNKHSQADMSSMIDPRKHLTLKLFKLSSRSVAGVDQTSRPGGDSASFLPIQPCSDVLTRAPKSTVCLAFVQRKLRVIQVSASTMASQQRNSPSASLTNFWDKAALIYFAKLLGVRAPKHHGLLISVRHLSRV